MSKYTDGTDLTDAEDDNRLVGLAKKGDVGAFEVLVTRHQKRMFNIAYRITGSQEDASEIVQDAFLAAYRSLKTFAERSLFSTWLHTITVNTARNRLKQTITRQGREPVSIDDPMPECSGKTFDPPSDSPSALDRLSSMELREHIEKCLGALDTGFREVIVLRDIQGFSYDEIAGMLSLAAGTVKSRLFRARDAVKDCLKRVWGEKDGL